jgi:hypothetical protein
MDEVTLVRELLPDAPPPAGAVVAAAQDRLDTVMRGRRRPPLRPRRGRPILLVTGVVAASAAAALLAVIMLPSGRPAGPRHSQAPGLPRSLTASGARQYLLAMAGTAGQAKITGRYWCSVVRQGSREMIAAGNQELSVPWLDGGGRNPSAARPAGFQYSVIERSQSEGCLQAPHGNWPGGTVTGYYQSLGAQFPTAADRAAWQRAGSPTRVGAWYASQSDSFQPGPRLRTGPKQGWGDYASLPADPARLKAQLSAQLPGPGDAVMKMEERSTGWSYPVIRNDMLFYAAVGVMGDPVRPAVRAAAYRVLASVPGVQVKPGIRDITGQVGTAVWLSHPGDRAVDYELIDPANGYLLGDENITVTRLLGLPPGSVLTYNERVSSGWTSTLPSQPAH